MKTMAKSILFLLVAYVISLIAAAVMVGAIMAMLSPQYCSDYSQAILVIWIAIAAIFCVSFAIVGFLVWRLKVGLVGRIVIVCGYGLLLLATYVVFVFGLMVAFNC